MQPQWHKKVQRLGYCGVLQTSSLSMLEVCIAIYDSKYDWYVSMCMLEKKNRFGMFKSDGFVLIFQLKQLEEEWR